MSFSNGIDTVREGLEENLLLREKLNPLEPKLKKYLSNFLELLKTSKKEDVLSKIKGNFFESELAQIIGDKEWEYLEEKYTLGAIFSENELTREAYRSEKEQLLKFLENLVLNPAEVKKTLTASVKVAVNALPRPEVKYTPSSLKDRYSKLDKQFIFDPEGLWLTDLDIKEVLIKAGVSLKSEHIIEGSREKLRGFFLILRKENIEKTTPYSISVPINKGGLHWITAIFNVNPQTKEVNIRIIDSMSRLEADDTEASNRLTKTISQQGKVQELVRNGCYLYLIEQASEINFNLYRNNYVLHKASDSEENPNLYYVNDEGKIENVIINDYERFNLDLAKYKKESGNKWALSNLNLLNLIEQNGGHRYPGRTELAFPDYTFKADYEYIDPDTTRYQRDKWSCGYRTIWEILDQASQQDPSILQNPVFQKINACKNDMEMLRRCTYEILIGDLLDEEGKDYLLDEHPVKQQDYNSTGSDVSSIKFRHYPRQVNLDTPLHFAAARGQLDLLMQSSYSAEEVNKQNFYGLTPLHFAIQNGHLRITEYLIEKGANINILTNNTALHFAAYTGKIEIVKLLVEKEASLNAKNSKEGSALHIAIEKGNVEVAKLLMNNTEIDLNIQDSGGRMPLHIAIEKGDINTARMLIEKEGINLNIKDSSGRSPLYLAIEKDDIEIAEMLSNQKSTDVDAENNYGTRPFHLAIIKKHTVLAKELIKKTAKLDSGYGSDNPLHSALQTKQEGIVTLLLEQKKEELSLRARGTMRATPFDLAVANKNTTAIKYFLDQNLFNLVTPDGKLNSDILAGYDNAFEADLTALVSASNEIKLVCEKIYLIVETLQKAQHKDKHTLLIELKQNFEKYLEFNEYGIVDRSKESLISIAVQYNFTDIIESFLKKDLINQNELKILIKSKKCNSEILSLILKFYKGTIREDFLFSFNIPIELYPVVLRKVENNSELLEKLVNYKDSNPFSRNYQKTPAELYMAQYKVDILSQVKQKVTTKASSESSDAKISSTLTLKSTIQYENIKNLQAQLKTLLSPKLHPMIDKKCIELASKFTKNPGLNELQLVIEEMSKVPSIFTSSADRSAEKQVLTNMNSIIKAKVKASPQQGLSSKAIKSDISKVKRDDPSSFAERMPQNEALQEPKHEKVYPIKKESQIKNLVVISLDYDGCAAPDKASDTEKKYQREHYGLFKDIGRKTLKAKEVQVIVGSTRQNSQTDAINALRNGNGSCFARLKTVVDFFNNTYKTSKYIFNEFLLGDLFNDQPAGAVISNHFPNNHQIHIQNKDQYPIPIPEADSKIFLVYAQMHHIASHSNAEEIDFYFYDDRQDLLKGIQAYYEKHKDHLPKNMKLHLYQHEQGNNKPLEFSSPIQGAGQVDTDYAQTLKNNCTKKAFAKNYEGATLNLPTTTKGLRRGQNDTTKEKDVSVQGIEEPSKISIIPAWTESMTQAQHILQPSAVKSQSIVSSSTLDNTSIPDPVSTTNPIIAPDKEPKSSTIAKAATALAIVFGVVALVCKASIIGIPVGLIFGIAAATCLTVAVIAKGIDHKQYVSKKECPEKEKDESKPISRNATTWLKSRYGALISPAQENSSPANTS